MNQFDGRVAVVTGGANGIGLGLARRFLDEGMKVVIADIHATDINAALDELRAHGDVIGVPTDVADEASMRALADTAMARFGAVHILCNNAGVGGFQRFSHTSLETWRWIMGVNLWGTILGCNIFMPILERQPEAHIVNTASMAGFIYAPFNHPYNVTKAGVVALTEGMFREFAEEKPHVGLSVLCPAFVATRIADDERNAPASHSRRSDTDPDMEQLRERVRGSLAGGKTPADVAEIVMRGIRERALHIFTHPEWLRVISDRAERIVAGHSIDTRFTADLMAR
jgi:NAD(P)-dependent dehydrogenase (short-subunit alcohol dehydrogenase family)